MIHTGPANDSSVAPSPPASLPPHPESVILDVFGTNCLSDGLHVPQETPPNSERQKVKRSLALLKLRDLFQMTREVKRRQNNYLSTIEAQGLF